MSGETTLSFHTISFLALVILLASTPSQLIFAQNSTEQSPFLTQKESIKILSPLTTQNATAGKDLLISGQSSDDNAKNCSVSIIVNDIRPYQSAIAKGTAGLNDFSLWEFVLSNSYTKVIEGMNKITAKLVCESSPTRWNSVFVNGMPNVSNVQIAPPQSNPIQSVERSNISETNLTNTEESENNDTSLLVSIFAQKNPEFVGKTDYNGKFIYSWTIGKKGDVGPLTVEVEATSQGYQSSLISSSFDIVDSSEMSKDNSAFGSTPDLNTENSEIDFVVAGDYGCDSKTRQTIKNMEEGKLIWPLP